MEIKEKEKLIKLLLKYQDEAKKCEKYHVKDFEVVNRAYRGMNECADKFPVKIWVKSKDGKERMYRL